jgi:hypothetical protein
MTINLELLPENVGQWMIAWASVCHKNTSQGLVGSKRCAEHALIRKQYQICGNLIRLTCIQTHELAPHSVNLDSALAYRQSFQRLEPP